MNISRAKNVTVNMNDYDDIPLTLTYTDSTDPNDVQPIDIRPWAFSFDFKTGEEPAVKKNYLLPASGSSDFLAVTGNFHNVLDMTLMWKDIKLTQVAFNGQYRLIQLVTDNLGNKFVHIIYTINGQRD